MPTWVIQRIKALAVPDEQDLDDIDEPLFIERFSKENYFDAALHEGGIAGVAQEKNEQDYDTYDEDSNMNEDTDNPFVISIEPAASRGKIELVYPPENPVELPRVELSGVAPP